MNVVVLRDGEAYSRDLGMLRQLSWQLFPLLYSKQLKRSQEQAIEHLSPKLQKETKEAIKDFESEDWEFPSTK